MTSLRNSGGWKFSTPFYIFIIISLEFGQVQAQPEVEWERAYPRDYMGEYRRTYCLDLIAIPDGYAMCGYYNDRIEEQYVTRFYLMLVDTDGDSIFTKLYEVDDVNPRQYASGIVSSNDGGFILVGGTSNRTPIVLKVDSEGNENWKIFYNDYPHKMPMDVVQVSDSEYVVSGYSYSDGNDFWVIKINTDGEVIWSRTYNNAEYENGTDLIKCREGGYAIVGWAGHPVNGYDAALLKIDQNGDQEWFCTFGTEYSDYGGDVTQGVNGDFIVCGYYRIDVHNEMDWVARLDGGGELRWFRTVSAVRKSISSTILDDGFVTVGFRSICRFDNNGELQWRINFAGDVGSLLSSIIELPDHSFVTAGTFQRTRLEEGPEWESFFIAKTTPDPLVDAPQEFSLSDTLDLGEVPVDTFGVGYLEVTNPGRRWTQIDSISISTVQLGLQVFTFDYDLPVRFFPWDTLAIPIMFTPSMDTAYTATLELWIDSASTEVLLKGRGVPLSAPSEDFILYPSSFILYPAYPNPFNSTAVTSYELRVPSPISLGLYDTQGRLVRMLEDGWRIAGEHQVTINAEGLSTGVYILNLRVGDAVQLQKAVIVK